MQTTGKSRKEACLLSQEDAEKMPVTTEENAFCSHVEGFAPKQNCHPDRSEAQWRDLRLFKLIQCFRMGAVRQVKDFFQFLGKVQQEMKLVHYPDRQQVRSMTLVVMVFVFLFAMYLRTLDWIFSPLEHWLFAH